MSYPERGASYRNKPAWMDRAVAGEKRAEGGPLIDSKGRTLDNPGNEFMTNEPPARLVQAGSHHAAQDARDQAARRTRNSRAMPDRIMVGGEPDRKAGGGVRRRAEGGLASSDMKPTDPTITAEDIKTHGTADNARAAARAREHAEKNPVPESDKREIMNRMGRGIGQSIGFKRGGRT